MVYHGFTMGLPLASPRHTTLYYVTLCILRGFKWVLMGSYIYIYILAQRAESLLQVRCGLPTPPEGPSSGVGIGSVRRPRLERQCACFVPHVLLNMVVSQPANGCLLDCWLLVWLVWGEHCVPGIMNFWIFSFSAARHYNHQECWMFTGLTCIRKRNNIAVLPWKCRNSCHS